MAQTLDEARQASARAVIDTANEYINATVPMQDQITGSMLIGYFMVQQPQLVNAAGMLFPLFAFIAAVQQAAQPFIDAALAAGSIEEAYAVAEPFDPTVVPAPKIDVWGTAYPAN